MKIVSWNVNGIRAAMSKGLEEFIKKENADIYCFQEIKATENDFDFSVFGMNFYVNSAIKKGYSGTLILSKEKPINVSYGIGIEEHDGEGRIITAEYSDFFLVNAYIPNSQKELKRLCYRMKFDSALYEYLRSLKKFKPVILTGDLNVAHKEIDLKNPKTNTMNAGFSIEERNDFSRLLSLGFIDSFRYFYPEKKDAYTWWSYMFRAREKNTGWRIDYFVVSEDFISNVEDSLILSDVYGSDHCPVELVIK